MDYRYAEYPPPPHTNPWVLSLWSFHAERDPAPGEPPYTVWPDGCVSLGAVCAPGFVMPVCVGPRVTSIQPQVRGGTALWGLRLWPDAAMDVLGVQPAELRDHWGPVPPTLAGFVAPLVAALRALPDARSDAAVETLGEWTRGLVTHAPAPEPRVRAAVRTIVESGGEIPVDVAARAAAWSARQLQRRFRERTGLTPREYARVRRLRDALARSLEGPVKGWSRVAAESGFVDHAHLTREVVALTGLQPTRAERQLRRTHHVDVRP